MNYKQSLLAITLLLISSTVLQAQQGGIYPSPSEHIANKLKDSLNLSASQRDSLFVINNYLQNQKQQARLQHPSADSVQYYLQRIENTRDSLYRPVLGSEKYLLYKQKKRYLISAN